MSDDKPRSLKHSIEQDKRKRQIRDPHMKALTDLCEAIEGGKEIPRFDPCDGGTDARCLFLFQDPGPKAVKSGFISRNNDDSSAEAFFKLNKHVGLHRKETISWNIVPWRVGSVDNKDVEEGIPWLLRLLELLKKLEVIVLAGKKAQNPKVVNAIGRRNVKTIPRLQFMPHPSPVNLRTRRESKDEIRRVLTEVKTLLNSASEE